MKIEYTTIIFIYFNLYRMKALHFIMHTTINMYVHMFHESHKKLHRKWKIENIIIIYVILIHSEFV